MSTIEKSLSHVVNAIEPSRIRKFFDIAAEMEDVISLGVGEPDFDTPWNVREAAMYSIEKGKTTYTENSGLLRLREKICEYQYDRYGLRYDPKKETLVTIGGSEAIDIIFRAILNPGDEVIVPQPCYVAYVPAVVLAYGKVVDMSLTSDNDFKISPEMLEATISDKTKAIILNYPSNPTGGVMSKEDYAKLVPIIKKHNIIVISDEIYAELSYDQEHASLASFSEIRDQVIVINGFSKAFAMTGWRLGYALGNETIIQAITKIHQYTIMCAPISSQYAGIEALSHTKRAVEDMRLQYLARRNFIVKAFNDMGLKTHTPQGAFYIFPNIQSSNLTSEEFCERLLMQERVACVPGTAFGDVGEGFIRVSYAYSIEEIKVAVERIQRFIKSL